MNQLFTTYAKEIVLLHVVFAMTWIGGMIAIRFAVHDALGQIEDKRLRLETTLRILSKFFQMVIVGIGVLGITGFVMMQSIPFTGVLSGIVFIKTQVWTTMTMVFAYIYYRFVKARAAFEANDISNAATMLAPLPKYLIPINIGLGLIAILLGIVLRGF